MYDVHTLYLHLYTHRNVFNEKYPIYSPLFADFSIWNTNLLCNVIWGCLALIFVFFLLVVKRCKLIFKQKCVKIGKWTLLRQMRSCVQKSHMAHLRTAYTTEKLKAPLLLMSHGFEYFHAALPFCYDVSYWRKVYPLGWLSVCFVLLSRRLFGLRKPI